MLEIKKKISCWKVKKALQANFMKIRLKNK